MPRERTVCGYSGQVEGIEVAIEGEEGGAWY